MSLKRAPASRHRSAKSRPFAVTSGARIAASAPIAQHQESLSRWHFLTNHSHVLLLLSRDSSLVLREVAWQVGITERAVQRILADLEADGFIEREKIGRKNHYRILTKQPLRHPVESHRTIGDLIALINGTRATHDR
jgi:predicted DNA-binding transcriptional regulator